MYSIEGGPASASSQMSVCVKERIRGGVVAGNEASMMMWKSIVERDRTVRRLSKSDDSHAVS